MDYRITIEYLHYSEWNHRKHRFDEEWRESGEPIKADIDAVEVQKSLEIALRDCEKRHGSSSNEAAFLRKLINNLES